MSGAGEGPTVDLFFDLLSPYAWLAVARIHDRRPPGLDCGFRLKPVLLAALLDSTGRVGPGEVRAQRDVMLRDVAWTAAELGLEFEPPPLHPFNPLSVLRLAVQFVDGPQAWPVVRGLFAAIWERGVDPRDLIAVVAALDAQGMNVRAEAEQIGSDVVKQDLRRRTGEAVAAGVFGVPTFRLPDGSLVWGQDRLPRVGQALRGELPETGAGLARALSAPVAAGRPGAPEPR